MVVMTMDNVERQAAYVKAQKNKGKGLGIVFADAFLRGMRDIGYKNPAWALAEEVDNSFQAAATTVSIRLGFLPENPGHAKPDMLAIIDDGNGMIPEMISYAVRWGGTDREDDRAGFGRFGYGLPSSIVSLAKAYTVFSKTRSTDWHAVSVDLDKLASAAGNPEKTEKLLAARRAELPMWVMESEDKIDLASIASGTVIVLEDLDRLRKMTGWITTTTLGPKLLQHFGVIYRHFLPERRIIVDGTLAQAVDPLFLMEHARFYNETPVRSEKVATRTFMVRNSNGDEGLVTIRASVLPPNFQLVDPSAFGVKGAKTNKRFEIMKDYNNILICRGKRQIDAIPPGWTKFQNYDANIKVEVDFDPALDEFFGITTAKQQIVIDEEMWQKLKAKGKNCGNLVDLVTDLRNRFEELQGELEATAKNRQQQEAARPSTVAMEVTEKFKDFVAQPTPEQLEEASRNLEQAAEERSRVTGESKEAAIESVKAETSKRKWEVEFAAIEEGPFYRVKRLGEQKRLIINTEHPFYTKLYCVTGPDAQSALEVMLFVIAERELESTGEAQSFYRSERQKWSERLRHALNNLVADEAMVDKKNAVAEFMYATGADSSEN